MMQTDGLEDAVLQAQASKRDGLPQGMQVDVLGHAGERRVATQASSPPFTLHSALSYIFHKDPVSGFHLLAILKF